MTSMWNPIKEAGWLWNLSICNCLAKHCIVYIQ